MARILLGAVVCSLFVATRCMYSASDDVIVLTASNFQREVIQSDSLWLVEFYAPWCGHCQQLSPAWKKAATALKGIVKVGAIDCDQHKTVGGEYGIRGFPTIKVFGANKNKPEDYQGGRTSEAIVDGALNALRSLVKDRLGGRGGGGSGGYDSGKQKKQHIQYEEQRRRPQQQEDNKRRNPEGRQQQQQQQQRKRKPSQERGSRQENLRQPSRQRCPFQAQDEEE